MRGKAGAFSRRIGDEFFSSVSLLLHFDGSNGSTTFTDSSGTPKTVAVSGGAVIGTAQSKFGGASANFTSSGTNPSVSVTGSLAQFGSADFTIEGWLYLLSGSPNESAVFSNYSGSWGGGIALFVNGGSTNDRWQLSTASSWPGIVSTATIALSTWTHYAVVRSSGVVSLYVDGVLQGTATASSGIDGDGVLLVNWTGGGNQSSVCHHDEFRLTNNVARYTANFTPPTAAFPDY